MRNYFTILVFLLATHFNTFSQDVYAQSQKPDQQKNESLKKKLPTLKNRERIDCLNEISEACLPFLPPQPDTVRAYANQALKEAEKINYIQGIATAYKNLGRIECLLITDLPSAEKYFSKSLELFIKNGDEQQIAWAWGALGLSKWVLSKFSEAKEAFEKAAQIFEKIGDTSNLRYTYNFMSHAELEWGHYAKSLQYALKGKELTGEDDYLMLSIIYSSVGDDKTALEYTRKRPADSIWGQFKYLGLASIFSRTKQYDSAFYYYSLFTDFAKKLGAGTIIKLNLGLGSLHLALKHYDTALVYSTEALKLSKTGNDKNQVMNGLLLLSKTYKEAGNYKMSMPIAMELLQTARETGARQHIRDSHFLLYELFDHFKKKDSAYHHLQQYTALKDSLDLDLSAQKLAFYKTKSERELAQSSITTLNDEKKLQHQKLQQAAQQKKVFIAGIIALLLIGIVLFRNIILKRKNERLRMENELELQKLESEKTNAELQQQKIELEMQALRAQMNPHFIFNSLNSINMFILENNKLQASDYLSKFSRLVRLILQNSQEAFIPLDSELEALRLYLELESLRFEQRFEYKISVHDEVDATMVKVPPLIIQPYAENAIWHGLMHKKEKGRLEIELYLGENILFCKITDDGIGRKKAAELKSKSSLTYKSMGMRITADRIAILQQQGQNTSFISVTDVVSSDSRSAGTEVLIKVPLHYD
jgi:tetratricopeptide (TPR) repeat protein